PQRDLFALLTQPAVLQLYLQPWRQSGCTCCAIVALIAGPLQFWHSPLHLLSPVPRPEAIGHESLSHTYRVRSGAGSHGPPLARDCQARPWSSARRHRDRAGELPPLPAAGDIAAHQSGADRAALAHQPLSHAVPEDCAFSRPLPSLPRRHAVLVTERKRSGE